jgi:ATP-dependent DNA helicase RecQ
MVRWRRRDANSDDRVCRASPDVAAVRYGRPHMTPSPVSPHDDADLDGSLDEALGDVFGFADLWPGQRDVMREVMGGRPVVAVMPTGAGKSLCYQLPAVLLARGGGLTVVVSPLIALMKDQVDALAGRGVASAALTSAAGLDEQNAILDRIRAGALAVAYVAPERFASRRFLAALSASRSRIGLFAVDEAHCISEWGHEFRPAYRALGEVVAQLAPPRLVALTATATPQVRTDIAHQLGMKNPSFHVRGFARPNLRLAVHPVGGVADKRAGLAELVGGRDGGSALVYAATRKNAEAYADALAAAGLRAGFYHAGMDDDDRNAMQDRFMADRLDAVVATNAFGMGIDKPDVRLVVHADLPRSPEAYYQEAGRAGRDGETADCVLLFNYSDIRVHEFLIDASYPSAEVLRALWKLLRERPGRFRPDALRDQLPDRPHPSVIDSAARILLRHGFLAGERDTLSACRPADLGGEFPPLDTDGLARRAQVERTKLRAMVSYAYHEDCRHRFLLSYFGDAAVKASPRGCGACDPCLSAVGRPMPSLAPPKPGRRRKTDGRSRTPRRGGARP